ncbi:MAG: Ni/Fe hydrogenase subunit alpha [Nanoarchaeota archaeon]
MSTGTREITLNHITKIEGHASLNLRIEGGKVTRCELSAVEGSRYFEGIVKGRQYFEAHEMTSRICGICSCAHVVAAISAIEDALGFTPSEQTKQLRILMTLGERIRSHATHLYFLALPDYLGYESALAMAPKFKKELQHALHLMKVGNAVIKLLAARELHPVSATVGGWLHLPKQEDLDKLKEDLIAIKTDAIMTCNLFFSLKYPHFESSGDWFSLKDPEKFAVLEGDLVSEKMSFKKKDYRNFLREYHEERSTSNFVVKSDHRYMVGALPRLNNSSGQLSPDAKVQLQRSGISLPSRNPYHNVIAQAIETVHCIDHAISLLETLKIKKEPVPIIKPRAGTGIGVIEVPRGTLWHEYTLDGNGVITNANIITPTAQNLLNIQEDIREFIPTIIDKGKEEMVIEMEKLIRSYDPCFSCSAHFLEVKWV